MNIELDPTKPEYIYITPMTGLPAVDQMKTVDTLSTVMSGFPRKYLRYKFDGEIETETHLVEKSDRRSD